MATAAEIGVTLSCVEDLDARCSTVTGRRAIAEAVARRWTTPRGRLGYDQDYGFDVTEYLNDDVDVRTLALMRSMMIAEAKKDERVLDVALTITVPTSDNGVGAYKFECFIYDAEGPFEFTFEASQAAARIVDPPLFVPPISGAGTGSTLVHPVPLVVGGPTFTSLTPTPTSTAGGATITVTGTNLTGATITVDGSVVSVTPISATSFSFAAPAHAVGAVDLIITTPGGAVLASSAITYQAPVVLASAAPDPVSMAGGETVTVTCTNAANVTACTYGGTSCATTPIDGTHFSFVTVAKSTGSQNIIAQTAIGDSNTIAITSAYHPSSASVTALSWFRADLGVTLVSTKVSEIADQIGAMDQTQGTDASRPTFTASDAAYGNQPVMTFATQFLSGTAVAALVAPISILIVGESTANNTSLFSTQAAASDMIWRSGSQNMRIYSSAGAITTGGAEAALGPAAWLLTDDGTGGGSACQLFRNNLTASPRFADTKKWVSTTQLDLGRGTAGIAALTGTVAEWIIWGGILSAADRVALAAYLSARYGLTVTAP